MDADIRVRLGAFIRAELLFDRANALSDDALLLRGRIDSIGLMELLTFVEDEFGVVLDPDDIDEEHFGTIDRLASLVESKLPHA